MDLRETVLTRRMRRFQFVVVAICMALAMIDGYEVLVMAFVAPYLARAWGIGPVEIGYLLSAGIFGMAVGAILISPLADRIGRRRHIILCLSFITIGMAASALATTVPMLAACRAFAGLFIGAIISSLNIMVSEYCPDRRRGTVMGIYGSGLPLGVALGGSVTGVLIGVWDWRAPFLFGAAITFLMLLVVLRSLPESIEFLVERRPPSALDQYNGIADRLGCPRAGTLPPARAAGSSVTLWRAMFGPVMLSRTLLLWVAYACVIAAFYFANTWTAKLMTDSTGDARLGGITGVLIAVGGVLGSLLFAALSWVIRPRLVTTLILFGGAIAFTLYADHHQSAGLALVLAVLVGITANGGVASFYSISPSIYPAATRASGVGLMIGVGRAVAILAPIVTGYLLRAGWSPADAYKLFAVVLAFAGIATLLLDNTYRGRSEDPDAAALPEQA